MTITLYDLSAADREIRFSPFCWKSRLALAHKQLAHETEAVWFTEKEKIAMSNQPLVPVLTDGDKVVNDSWNIALYLEEQYPDAPSLFLDSSGKALAESTNQWVDTVLVPLVRPMVLMDIFALISDEDKVYFRQSREERLGVTLEEYSANAEQSARDFQKELDTVREVLNQQPYLGGSQPSYADISLLGVFLWIVCASGNQCLESQDVVCRWYNTMLNQYSQVIPKRLL